MRFLCLVFVCLMFLSFSFVPRLYTSQSAIAIKDKLHHQVPLRALTYVKSKGLRLTYTEFFTRKEGAWDEGPLKRIRIQYGSDIDTVYVYEQDTLISTFRSRDFVIQDKMEIFAKDGKIIHRAQLSNECHANEEKYARTYYDVFTAFRQGKSESFFADGQLSSLTYYRKGQNDTFEKIWYTNKRLYACKHKDTQMFFNEDNGVANFKSYYTFKGKIRMYGEYAYWPNSKLKSENYYTDESKDNPCYTWKFYDKTGRLTKQIVQKKHILAPAVADDVKVYVSLTVEIARADLEQAMTDSIRRMLKREYITTDGHYRMVFSIKDGRKAQLVKLDGPNKMMLEYGLKDMLKNWRSSYYAHQHSGSSTDFFTMEFYIGE